MSHEPRIAIAADGSASLHGAHDKTKCIERHIGPWRCVDCCKQEPDTDVIECAECGYQRQTRCTFDDDTA
jgi:hypothetical protein